MYVYTPADAPHRGRRRAAGPLPGYNIRQTVHNDNNNNSNIDNNSNNDDNSNNDNNDNDNSNDNKPCRGLRVGAGLLRWTGIRDVP